MHVFAIALLLFLAVISGVGVFSRVFQDNLLQRIGMVALSLGSISLAYRVWLTEWMSQSDITLIIGAVLYSLGTWTKTLHYYKRAHQYE